MLAAALAYARGDVLGFPVPVFPCGTHKRPIVKTGFKAATTDGALITEWWGRNPVALIGMPTGERTGLYVIDVDSVEGHGVDGIMAFEAMELKHDDVHTLAQQTASGGFQYFFLVKGKRLQIKNSAGAIRPGLDVRCRGGYVIVPPSFRVGARYRWNR